MGLFGKKKGAAEAGQEQKDAGSANSSPVFQDQKSRLESELSAMTEITLKLTDNVLSFSPTATWELTENEAIVARNRISELEKEVEEATRKGMKWKAEVEDVKKQVRDSFDEFFGSRTDRFSKKPFLSCLSCTKF
mgnify:FL=1